MAVARPTDEHRSPVCAWPDGQIGPRRHPLRATLPPRRTVVGVRGPGRADLRGS